MNRQIISFCFLSLRVYFLLFVRAHDSARRLLDRLKPPGSDHGILYYWVGYAYARRKKFELAEECLTKASALDPEWPLTEILLGDMRMHTSQYAAAVDLYRNVLENRPELRARPKNELLRKYRRALIAAGYRDLAAQITEE